MRNPFLLSLRRKICGHTEEVAKEHRKPGTYDKIRHHLSSFARYVGKQRKIGTLSGSDLSLWTEAQTQRGSTMSNEAIVSVIRCFNWAVGKKYIVTVTNNVSNVPDKPRRKRREVTFSNDEWLEIKSHVRDRAFRDFLDFMWETGCRPLEARTMYACHVDVERGLVDGVDSVTLSQLMGHADVGTLAKNYVHLSRRQDYLKSQAERVRPGR